MSGFNVGVGGAWKSGKPFVGVGGAWKAVQAGFVGVGGVWKQFYTAFGPPSVSVSNGSWFPHYVNDDPAQGIDHYEGGVTCTVTGGSGSFSAVWSGPGFLSGDATGGNFSSPSNSPTTVSVVITDTVTGLTGAGSGTIS